MAKGYNRLGIKLLEGAVRFEWRQTGPGFNNALRAHTTVIGSHRDEHVKAAGVDFMTRTIGRQQDDAAGVKPERGEIQNVSTTSGS